MKDKKIKNIKPSFSFMDLALVLLCVVIVLGRFAGGFYAAYTTKGDSGDSARVIKFGDITLTEQLGDTVGGKLIVTPGVDIEKSVTIKFDGSESATYVFVEIELAGDWVFTNEKTFSVMRDSVVLMQWTIDEYWTYVDGTGANKKYVFYKHLNPNEILTAKEIIKDGKITVEPEVTKGELEALCNAVEISITATVVQSIGFVDAKEAYDSISGN